jgi:aryl-alcohol dehydrogenase-like predicted oxidoreductase
VDSAINYRLQRSERSVGAALKQLAARGFPRDGIVVCTKAGFLTPDGEMPDDANEYFSREFIEPGIFRPEDIAAGCHCMTPRYLADQLERSRRNLGVECVDVFYLHNPETQLSEVPLEEFRRRLGEAFAFLESAVAAGKIGAYGLATWNAFRDDPKSQGYLSLASMEEIARAAGGAEHHFRFVQLPLNLAMPEALLRPNQVVEHKTMAMVQAARALKITLVSSAALLQGQLTRNLPPYIAAALGTTQDWVSALQFARSVPGVTTALAGMSHVEHVRANLDVIGIEPAPRDQFLKLFEPRG